MPGQYLLGQAVKSQGANCYFYHYCRNSNLSELNGKLNTKIRQKHVNITTDQYGQYNLKQHLPGGEGTILNVHSGSGQYGIFLYAGNTIRVCNVGTGDFSLANNASFDIYIIYTLSAYLEN